MSDQFGQHFGHFSPAVARGLDSARGRAARVLGSDFNVEDPRIGSAVEEVVRIAEVEEGLPDYVVEYAVDAVAFAAALLPPSEPALPLLNIIEILRAVIRFFPRR